MMIAVNAGAMGGCLLPQTGLLVRAGLPGRRNAPPTSGAPVPEAVEFPRADAPRLRLCHVGWYDRSFPRFGRRSAEITESVASVLAA